MVLGRAAGVDGPRLEEDADLVQRGAVLGVAAAVDPSPTRHSANPDRRSSAWWWIFRPRSGRAQEPGDDAGTDGETQIMDGGLVAISLGQATGLDHGQHPV